MDFNLITNIETCFSYVQSNPTTLLYAHIPTAAVSLLIGFFVLFKNRNLNSIILFIISVLFSIWSFLDLVIWYSYSGLAITVSWAILGIVGTLLFVFSLYFVSVFIEKKDISFYKKLILGLLMLPTIIASPSRLNISNFNITGCEAVENDFIVRYNFGIEILISVWIILYAILGYRKAEKEFRKQIILLTIGILLFLLSFSWSNIFGVLTLQWDISQYGLFGMPIFMAFLAYLIVKFEAFNIKLLGAQALIVGQFIAIAAMFAFVTNVTNQVLIGITLILTLIMGFNLIRSVKKEVQAREELEVTNLELAERKGELQMMSDKLAQSNDQLRKLDNAKSEFISIASHQLRTPLTAIKGFISMLLEGSYGKLVPEQESVLNKVYTSNERLVTLVEDLLNVSRIESGRMEFKFENAQVADVCQEVYDTFVQRAKEHKLYLEYKLPEVALPEVFIDKVKVREVISNLVDNALKYTPDGKGGVTMKVEELGENLRVTISDTGIGVPKTELPYLFAKFSRGKDIGRLNTGGTGLGLYVGRAMIENNGGKIWAESDGEGKGSRFIIELPLKQSEELIKKWG